MGVDLTRFDFYAKNFMHSDNIRGMSFEEIGQYVFLLCESWLTGKDCTLPSDPRILSSLCRGVPISTKVLDMFPIVPEIARRRNTRLYEEWLMAIKRCEDGKSAARSRYNRSATAEPPFNDGTAFVMLRPDQIVSDQIKSNQEGEFHHIAVKYRAVMGRGHSKSKIYRERYSSACREYGEDLVLKVADEWLQANKWRTETLGNSGLRFFFTDLPGMISEILAAEKLAPKETIVPPEVVESANAVAREATEKMLDDLKREEEEIAELKKHPNEF